MQSLLVLFTIACSLVTLEAAYLRNADGKDTPVQQQTGDVHIPYFMDQYSPEVVQMLSSPQLLQELHDAMQQIQQQPESEVRSGERSKKAQTFVRFGKRAQTFVRFGK